MKIAVLDPIGQLLPVAHALSTYGHAVHWWGLPNRDAPGVTCFPTAPSVITLIDWAPELVILGAGSMKYRQVVAKHCQRVIGDDAFATALSTLPAYRTHVSDALNAPLLLCGWWNGRELTVCGDVVEERGLTQGGGGPCIPVGYTFREHYAPHDDMLAPLRRLSYQGPIYFSEQGIRAGLDAGLLCVLAAVCHGHLTDLFIGEMPTPVSPSALAVHITLPPYPYSSPCSVPIIFTPDLVVEKHVWFIDRVGETVGGTDGDVGWVSARGEDAGECLRRVTRTLSNLTLSLPALQYRTDLAHPWP